MDIFPKNLTWIPKNLKFGFLPNIYPELPFTTDPIDFQLVVLLIHVQVQPGAEYAKITYSMRVRIARALTPGSPGNDLNPVIRTDCICSVKCAEAAWNYKSGRHSAL